MGKYEVLELLKKNDNTWFLVEDIAKLLKITKSSASDNCKRLRKDKWVEVKQIKVNRRKTYVYRSKNKN